MRPAALSWIYLAKVDMRQVAPAVLMDTPIQLTSRGRACRKSMDALCVSILDYLAFSFYRVWRDSIALPRVTSSANSRSPPTGKPLARRETVTPSGLIRRAR